MSWIQWAFLPVAYGINAIRINSRPNNLLAQGLGSPFPKRAVVLFRAAIFTMALNFCCR